MRAIWLLKKLDITRWLIGISKEINLIIRLSKSVSKKVHQDAPSLLPEIPNMRLINGEQFHHGISCLAESFRHWHPCATQLCPCKRTARLWDARPTEDDFCSPLTSSIFLGVGNDLRLVILGDKIPWTPGNPRHHKDTESRSLHLHQTLQVISWSNLRCFLLFLGGDRGLGLTKMDEKKSGSWFRVCLWFFFWVNQNGWEKWGKYLEPFIFYSFAVFQGWLQISIEILHEAAVLGYVFCLMFCACPMTSSTSFLQSHFGCPGRTHIGSFVFPVPNARFYTFQRFS